MLNRILALVRRWGDSGAGTAHGLSEDANPQDCFLVGYGKCRDFAWKLPVDVDDISDKKREAVFRGSQTVFSKHLNIGHPLEKSRAKKAPKNRMGCGGAESVFEPVA